MGERFRVGECFLIVLLMRGGRYFHTLWTEGSVPVKLPDIDDVFFFGVNKVCCTVRYSLDQRDGSFLVGGCLKTSVAKGFDFVSGTSARSFRFADVCSVGDWISFFFVFFFVRGGGRGWWWLLLDG